MICVIVKSGVTIAKHVTMRQKISSPHNDVSTVGRLLPIDNTKQY